MAEVRRTLLLAAAVAIGWHSTTAAQVYYEPQPKPIVTAESEPWFQAGEPITFEGNFYYPAGPRVFFDGNVMVRAGSYRGVPLYANTTLEPYSKVLVPLSGGLMQPYERLRTGDVAGSTGSQAPSFPVSIAGEPVEDDSVRPDLPATASPPMLSEAADLAFEEQLSDRAAAARRRDAQVPPSARGSVGMISIISGAGPGLLAPRAAAPPPPRNVIEAGTTPKGLNEIYINYLDSRWKSAGRAVPMAEGEYEVIGDYRGFSVYAASGEGPGAQRIYLPSQPGLLAPYERAGKPIAY